MKSRLEWAHSLMRPMLQSTFLFLNGIGESTERLWWEEGLATWDAFLANPTAPRISTWRKAQYDEVIQEASNQWKADNSRFFSRLLKPRDHWRLYPNFQARAAFLDIETNGLPFPDGMITVVGIYGKGVMTTLIHGETLSEERLQAELASYDLIVTFFGSGFDLPFLKAQYPNLLLDHPHIDLCFAARRLGLTGGLKKIEVDLGCYRPTTLNGLTGWDAVRLWEEWQLGHSASGELLIQYNEADCKNLESLANLIYHRLVQRHGLPQYSPLP
jgi:uncharacterized protein